MEPKELKKPVTIGANDYYLQFSNIYLATDKKPGLFRRAMLGLFFGFKIITEQERKEQEAENNKRWAEWRRSQEEAERTRTAAMILQEAAKSAGITTQEVIDRILNNKKEG